MTLKWNSDLKYTVLILKKGKIIKSEGVEEGGRAYKYIGILKADGVKHEEIKQKTRKYYIRHVRNILRFKLNRGNTITAINSRAVPVIRYETRIIGCTKTE